MVNSTTLILTSKETVSGIVKPSESSYDMIIIEDEEMNDLK